MKIIKYNTIDIANHTGYGNAGRYLRNHLDSFDVHFVSHVKDIVLNFCMPKDYIYGTKYTIGYTPWESTEVPESWRDGLSRVDDLWTPSSWTRDIFQEITGREDIFVLPHGISPTFIPVKHEEPSRQPFTFLHVGEPAVRKGGDIVLRAWHKAFRHRKDVKLIYKTTGIPMARVKDRGGSIIAQPYGIDNVEIKSVIMSELELWRLYSEVHCMVYPTKGEGFGLIPLEAMASGLPTICTAEGGTKDFAFYGFPLRNNVWAESNEAEHPGKWIVPDVDEVIEKMEWVLDHYRVATAMAYSNAATIRHKFDWENVASMAVDRILDRT